MIDLKDIERIEEKIDELCSFGAITVNDNKTQTLINLMAGKSANNLRLAKALFKLSAENKTKESIGLVQNDTFYDWVIIISYYSMYHITQALLASKNIRIRKVRVHEATLYSFAKFFIINNELQDDLFFMYEDAENKAEQLFTSLSEERKKRGEFTYERLPKANISPARESLDSAIEYVRAIETILKRKRYL